MMWLWNKPSKKLLSYINVSKLLNCRIFFCLKKQPNQVCILFLLINQSWCVKSLFEVITSYVAIQIFSFQTLFC